MFSKILWATDGSEAADKALPYVEALAGVAGGAVEVVYVLDNPGGSMVDVDQLQAPDSDVQSKLKDQVDALSEAGVAANLILAPGRQRTAAHKIAEIAEQVGASMIVVGTRGHTAAAGGVLGSVTQRLLHVAPCPVVAVPDHISPPQPRSVT
jgi:nucleotide-binding universal stress UspA family protein